MKKRKRSKLMLNRETLRSLDPDKMAAVAGAAGCTSDRCTNNCTGGNCTLGGSECICPLTDDSVPCPSVIFCTGLSCLGGC